MLDPDSQNLFSHLPHLARRSPLPPSRPRCQCHRTRRPLQLRPGATAGVIDAANFRGSRTGGKTIVSGFTGTMTGDVAATLTIADGITAAGLVDLSRTS